MRDDLAAIIDARRRTRRALSPGATQESQENQESTGRRPELDARLRSVSGAVLGSRVRRRYRRSRHVLCYWTDAGAVVYNYATAVQAQATDLTWQLLDCCSELANCGEGPTGCRADGCLNAWSVDLLESLVSATFVEASGSQRASASEVAWTRGRPGIHPPVSSTPCPVRCTWGDRERSQSETRRRRRERSPMPASVKPPGAGA